MLEDLPAPRLMKEAPSNKNTCMEPSCNTKAIEDPRTSSYVEKNTKNARKYIHYLAAQQFDINTMSS